jgi:hypothetical protein
VCPLPFLFNSTKGSLLGVKLLRDEADHTSIQRRVKYEWGVTPLPQMLYNVHPDTVDYTCYGLSSALVRFREETILFVMSVGPSVFLE